MSITKPVAELRRMANPAKAKILQSFSKTGKGEYGAGDIFWGIPMPNERQLAKKYWQKLSQDDLDKLLRSKVHEQRLLALLVQVTQYQEGDTAAKNRIYKHYLARTAFINNWDLVDLSAPKIVGEYLLNKNRKILYNLARSKNLWKKRIAVISTFTFIKQGQARDTLAIVKLLLKDKHDLIHKACGWMLREVGKRCDETTLLEFLDQNCGHMPRTMLRYAIERLPRQKQLSYLNLKH